jgi:hypothetical protein
MSENSVRKVMPGQPGTKKLVEKYGDALVCVRYRYDSERQKKIKTVELVIEESNWRKNVRRIPANKMVYVRVAYGEVRVGRLVKAAGGRWNRNKKLWELPYREVQALGLEERIIPEITDNRNSSGRGPPQ